MAFGLAAQARQLLESSGYTFVKRDEDGWWQMMDGLTVVAVKRSMGDLIREQANNLRVW